LASAARSSASISADAADAVADPNLPTDLAAPRLLP